MLLTFVREGDAYTLLRDAARQAWGLDTPEIVRRTDGKPVFARYPDLHFSLSHSGDLALCALSDKPVGADIELVRPRRAGLPAYVLWGEEHERYLALGGDWPAFYTLWTEKESIVKYTGEGLRAWRRTALPAGCVITNLAGAGWRGAVCGHENTFFEP